MAGECAIVFRSHCQPGPALQRRMLRWSKSFSAQPLDKRCHMWVTSDLSTDTDRLLLKKVAETNDKTNRTLAFEGILEPPQKIVQRSG